MIDCNLHVIIIKNVQYYINMIYELISKSINFQSFMVNFTTKSQK